MPLANPATSRSILLPTNEGVTDEDAAQLAAAVRNVAEYHAPDQVPPSARGAIDNPAAGAVFAEYTPYPAERMADTRCIVGPRYK